MDITDWENKLEEEFFNAESAPKMGDYKFLMTESGFKFFRETDNSTRTIIGGYEKTIEEVRKAIEKINIGEEIEWDEAYDRLKKYAIFLENSISLYNRHPESKKTVLARFEMFCLDDGEIYIYSDHHYEITGLSIKSFVEKIEAFSKCNSLASLADRSCHFFTEELCRKLFVLLNEEAWARTNQRY